MHRVGMSKRFVAAAVLVLATATHAQGTSDVSTSAEVPPPKKSDPTASGGAGKNEITVDVNFIGATVGYARRTGPKRLIGGALGIGGDALNFMLISGSHFSEDWGLSYEDKDGYQDKFLLEILHLDFFMRHEPGRRWEIDTGIRVSAFFHWDESDDDPGGGLFYGVYSSFLFGSSRFKIGPRVLVGVFSEGDPEFGIAVMPVAGRIRFGW